MKKIFTILALAAVSASAFAQKTQQYMRVEFTVPMTSYDDPASGKTGTAVAQGQKDNYIYVNPTHQYLDFNVSEHPFSYRSTTTDYNENSYYYLDQVRNTQTYVEDTKNKYPFQVQYIKSITPYSMNVETVKLLSAPSDTIPQEFTYAGDGKKYMVGEFTFNRLPRNVEELKTLIEPNGDGKRTHCHNPMFVAAVMYLIYPRLLDCSQDCRDMIDYMHGKFHTPKVETYGISNRSFQNLCISHYTDGKGKDANGYYWNHNHLFQWFKGALPSNQYMPNGDASKGYFGQDSYTVYVAWDTTSPMLNIGDLDAIQARFLLLCDPHITNKADLAVEQIQPLVVGCRSTKKNGWFFQLNPETYYYKGKAQTK